MLRRLLPRLSGWVVLGLLEVLAGVLALVQGERFGGWALVVFGALTVAEATDRARSDRIADRYARRKTDRRDQSDHRDP